MAEYVIKLDEQQSIHLERRAAELGFASVVDYLMALAAADALVEQLRPDWQDADEDPQTLEAEFRQAWHDVMTGRTYPVTSLSEFLKDDDDEQVTG